MKEGETVLYKTPWVAACFGIRGRKTNSTSPAVCVPEAGENMGTLGIMD